MIAAIHRQIWAVLFLLLSTGTTQFCWAHAILMDSTPKVKSTVKGSDIYIHLRFNVRVDGGRSRVQLVAPNGTAWTVPLKAQLTPDTLQTHATDVKPGFYKLEWQVLASDGHISRGEIPFTVN